jgi:hypothetical protein
MLGPALVRRDAVEDVGELSFETRVNGEIVQARARRSPSVHLPNICCMFSYWFVPVATDMSGALHLFRPPPAGGPLP